MAVALTLSGVVVGAVIFGVGLVVNAGILVATGLVVLALTFLLAVIVPGDARDEHAPSESPAVEPHSAQ